MNNLMILFIPCVKAEEVKELVTQEVVEKCGKTGQGVHVIHFYMLYIVLICAFIQEWRNLWL